MESTNMLNSTVELLLLSFSTALFYFVIQKVFNLIFKRGISITVQKNAISDNKIDTEKLRKLLQLRRQFKPEYYFKDDFYKLLPELNQNFLNEFDEFGKYVSFQLRILQFESNKHRLQSEIRKIILRIVEEDTKSYLSSDTFAKAQTQDNVAKQ